VSCYGDDDDYTKSEINGDDDDYTKSEINGECGDCGEETVDGVPYKSCSYSPVSCDKCGHRECDESC